MGGGMEHDRTGIQKISGGDVPLIPHLEGLPERLLDRWADLRHRAADHERLHSPGPGKRGRGNGYVYDFGGAVGVFDWP